MSASDEVSRDDIPDHLPRAIKKALAGLPVSIAAFGLRVTSPTSDDDIKLAIKALVKVQNEATIWLRFALGDLWSTLPDTYGCRARWALKNFGEGTYQQLKRNGWIAAHWPLDRREAGLC